MEIFFWGGHFFYIIYCKQFFLPVHVCTMSQRAAFMAVCLVKNRWKFWTLLGPPRHPLLIYHPGMSSAMHTKYERLATPNVSNLAQYMYFNNLALFCHSVL